MTTGESVRRGGVRVMCEYGGGRRMNGVKVSGSNSMVLVMKEAIVSRVIQFDKPREVVRN